MNRQSRDKYLIFGAPLIKEAEVSEVVDCLNSGWLGTGPKVAKFEEMVKEYTGSNYAIAVNSCTAAMHLSLLVSGIKSGDEVITTPMTFCSTVNSIIHVGATPVLADVNSNTMNIDPDNIIKQITPKTKAIIPVHFAGQPCEMDEIMNIAKAYKLKVIEDCAHAIETEYNFKKAGTFGDFGCYSFYVTKNVITGEGGMVLCKKPEHAKKIKMLALHGMSKDAWTRYSDSGYNHYFVNEAGFKYNMMDLQAAIGIHQLKRVEKNWERRRYVWNTYNAAFADFPIKLPSEPNHNNKHAYHLYTILINEGIAGIRRDDFLKAMHSSNIGTGVHYLSIPEHPYYKKTFGWKPDDYPNAMKIGQQTVSLPLSPSLTETDIDDVIIAVKTIINR